MPRNWEHAEYQGKLVQDFMNVYGDLQTAKQMSKIAEHFLAHECGYSQYWGWYDGWVKVRVVFAVRTERGQAFLKGDVTIGKLREDGRYSVMSWRNGYVDTSLRADYVEAL